MPKLGAGGKKTGKICQNEAVYRDDKELQVTKRQPRIRFLELIRPCQELLEILGGVGGTGLFAVTQGWSLGYGYLYSKTNKPGDILVNTCGSDHSKGVSYIPT